MVIPIPSPAEEATLRSRELERIDYWYANRDPGSAQMLELAYWCIWMERWRLRHGSRLNRKNEQPDWTKKYIIRSKSAAEIRLLDWSSLNPCGNLKLSVDFPFFLKTGFSARFSKKVLVPLRHIHHGYLHRTTTAIAWFSLMIAVVILCR